MVRRLRRDQVSRASAVFVLVAFVSRCAPAYAAPCESARPMIQGGVADCSGLLVPMSQASAALECVTVDLPELEARRRLEFKTCRADFDACEHMAESERSRAERLSIELDRLGSAVEPDPLWKHPAVWGAVGFVLGAAGSVYLVTRLNDAR